MSVPVKPLAKPAISVGAKLPTAKTAIELKFKDHIAIFYGPPGVGKTTFVNGLSASTFFLSTDRGTRTMAAMRWECSEYGDFLKALDLMEKPGAPKYEIVCVDHVDDLCMMAEHKVCSDLGIESLSDAGYGKGWKAYKDAIGEIIIRLKRLGSGLVFIAHESIKTVKANGLETDRIMPDMSKSAWKLLIPLADLVGHCGFKAFKDPKTGHRVEKRVLKTEPEESLYAKDRTRRKKPTAGWELLESDKFLATFVSE